MEHNYTNHHVKLVLVILHTKHHGHGLSDLDNAAHLTGIGAFSNLQKIFYMYVNFF